MDYYDMDQPFDDIPDYDIYEPSASEIWSTCAWPSIQQICNYSLPFIFWNIAFRITSQASKRNSKTTLHFYSFLNFIIGLTTSFFFLFLNNFSRYSDVLSASIFNTLRTSIIILHIRCRLFIQSRLHIP